MMAAEKRRVEEDIDMLSKKIKVEEEIPEEEVPEEEAPEEPTEMDCTEDDKREEPVKETLRKNIHLW